MKGGAFLRSVAHTYGSQLLLLPMSLGASALQVRLIGPGGRGQVALVTACAAVAVLYLGFGLGSSITYHVAGGKVSPRALARPLFALLLFLVSVLFVGLVGLSHTDGFALFLGDIAPSVAIPTVVFLFALPLLNSWLLAVLSARREFGYINAVSVGVVLVPLSAYSVALVAHVAVSPTVFALATLVVAEAVRSVAIGVRVFRMEGGKLASGSDMRVPLRAMLSYSLLAYACDAIQFLTYRVDLWLVRYFRGDTELGHYSLAVTLGELVWLVSGAFATVLFPHVPALAREVAVQLTLRVAVLAFAATAAVSVLGYVLAIPLLPVIFSAAFAPSVPLLGILLLGVVPFSLAKVVGNYLAGVGAMRLSFYSAVIGMIVCVSLDCLLIPLYGAHGAAAASAIAYVAFTVTVLGLFSMHSGLSLRQFVAHAARPMPPLD